VPYDGSTRSERALARVGPLCRTTGALMGIAVVQPRWCAFASPWVHVPGIVVSEREMCSHVLRQVPPDVSVRFLVSPYPAGVSQIAAFAKRLACDSVFLPHRGRSGRRLGRALARRGLSVFMLPEKSDPAPRAAEATPSTQLPLIIALEP
jgi:nucleotide-binding universal stress UspA family protein